MCINKRNPCRPSSDHPCCECQPKKIDWTKPIEMINNDRYEPGSIRLLGRIFGGTGWQYEIVGKDRGQRHEHRICTVGEDGKSSLVQNKGLYDVQNVPPPKVKYDVYNLKSNNPNWVRYVQVVAPHGASLNPKYRGRLHWTVVEMQTVEFTQE